LRARRILVVNADDLGLHPDIDRGIEEAHREGIVTSASISAVGASFEGAVELCHRNPRLDVGVHLTLVGERPLADPSVLGGLVTAEGSLPHAHPALTARALAGLLRRDAVERELAAQVDRVNRAGLSPSHLDAHQHVHLLPRVWPVVIELAKAHGIRWVRVPVFAPSWAGRPGTTRLVLRLGMNALASLRRASLGALRSADSTPALGQSGRLTPEVILRALRRVPPGALAELVTHPGVTTPALRARYDWGYDWSGETTALRDPELRRSLERDGFELRGFADLAS
jgi:predicted glycoside hydrolase/deacetylase ChbG (UPF0249 family)